MRLGWIFDELWPFSLFLKGSESHTPFLMPFGGPERTGGRETRAPMDSEAVIKSGAHAAFLEFAREHLGSADGQQGESLYPHPGCRREATC